MNHLANALHMEANHQTYFPRWSRARYARMWAGVNVFQAILSGWRGL